MQLNINSDAVVRFTAKLEQIRKSALPSAVRNTLNNCAFDVKQTTMPKQADADFVKRSPNFFKANSSVDKAVGWDVNSMRSTVGFIESRLQLGSKRNKSVDDLNQQEHSGAIDRKQFIPLNTARTDGPKSLVKPANRLSVIGSKIVVARNLSGANKKQQFIKAVAKAGVGGYVLGSDIKGENILFRVNSIDPGNGLKFKLTALYDYKKGRKVHVKEKGFMRTASLQTANKMEQFFIANAKFQLEKIPK